MGDIYGLLVGINAYSPAVGKLTGCLNDVDHFRDYLSDNFDPGSLRLEVLKDADATRGNIIEQFRSHLGKATAEDVVVFQYCGHGAQCRSAEPFMEYFPDGKDEGLVCFDSRAPGGFDLADKELALLLAEVAVNKPDITMLLDCCHSGSATRGADDFINLKARQTHEVFDERPLESYLDGYYAALRERGQSLEIPASRHILLAACERVQKAWEAKDHSGVFTSTLLKVLGKTGTDVSYADLFMRCRATVRELAMNQDPQFETYGGFNAYDGFLGRKATQHPRSYRVYFDNGWQVDCGALHGLPSDADKEVELALYPEADRSTLAGRAITTQVGAQKSALELLDIDADTALSYQAEITSLPVPPLAVALQGDDKGAAYLAERLSASEDRCAGVSLLTDSTPGARYTLSAEDDCYTLTSSETDRVIQGARGYTEKSADYMFSILKRVAAWERAAALQNRATKMNPDDVQFKFCEVLDNGELYPYPGNEITIDIEQGDDGVWKHVDGKLRANNRSHQPLHLALFYFSEDYGVQALYNERIEPTDADFTLTPMGNELFSLGLDDDEGNESVTTIKLVVSTEKVDDFMLEQKPLQLGFIEEPDALRGLQFGAAPERKKIHKNEWFTRDLHFKIVRRLNQVSTDDAPLADGKVLVKGHPSLHAGISLSAAKTTTRGVGPGADISAVLERQGMEMLNFSGTRGDNESILELTDMQNPEVLEQNPLEIELDVALAEDEFILPLAFDGEHILLTGDPSQDESGRTHISIDQIPDIPDNRRSLGKALKLYFFKTYLKREDVNELAWVEYGLDGSVTRHADIDGVKQKVANAKNVLLLIHGILGDTAGMAEGLQAAKAVAGAGIDEKFDVVLTYDYENLNTPIQKTATALKGQLRDVGLHEHDDVQLTLLVHSMGGLVSRWFIEREGGNKVVDHLVMCGTPNAGSPLGKIDGARKISHALTTVAINAFPAFAPFGGALIYALNRSKKLTPCLEEMNPSSDFLETLNASDDPGVRYTVIAGDTREYEVSTDGLIAGLVAKLGRGAVFELLHDHAAHDIAVSVDSILGVPGARSPAPVKHNVVGFHTNYFVNEASLRTLAAVEW